ncbi:MAG: cbb3-type cytochrome c oxidase subunit I [Betaproteobacteria bacterium]|nr:cbb3-type cytochrome c oxidase subunit I [Betaproteobacteria bacterium]MDE2209007.1 cbb3-type cytochrome c oxidase subunit I [Betaproteobacteria bacterium]MDE2359109.1 cbb3-type cytochrome c oxidase subunit I [Betaproteobacteria bacterium]
MLPRNRWFIAAALAYALLGGLLGLAWLAFPGKLPALAPRAHAHLMLVGFVGMMIFGVGLHVLPRFTGRTLFSERLADAQFALANLGLLAMVAGWLAGVPVAAVTGGALLWAGFALFAINVVATVRPWARRG